MHPKMRNKSKKCFHNISFVANFVVGESFSECYDLLFLQLDRSPFFTVDGNNII